MSPNTFTKLRKLKKLTQPQMADILGVSNGYISQLENNKKTPSLEIYKKLEALLGPEIRSHFF